jgi:hypothetical protein
LIKKSQINGKIVSSILCFDFQDLTKQELLLLEEKKKLDEMRQAFEEDKKEHEERKE